MAHRLRLPNTRVQRTRSSPSALRSPLTRCPLGLRKVSIVLGFVALLGCASTPKPGPRLIPTAGGRLDLVSIVRQDSTGSPAVFLEYRSAASPHDREALGREVEAVWGWFEPFAEREHLAIVRIIAISPGAGPFGGDRGTSSSIRRLPGGGWCWFSAFWLPAAPCSGPEA